MQVPRIDWSSALRQTTNNKTGKTYFYFHVCGQWKKVSEQTYRARENDAERADSFQTKTAGDLVTQIKTIYGTHYSKR